MPLQLLPEGGPGRYTSLSSNKGDIPNSAQVAQQTHGGLDLRQRVEVSAFPQQIRFTIALLINPADDCLQHAPLWWMYKDTVESR